MATTTGYQPLPEPVVVAAWNAVVGGVTDRTRSWVGAGSTGCATACCSPWTAQAPRGIGGRGRSARLHVRGGGCEGGQHRQACSGQVGWPASTQQVRTREASPSATAHSPVRQDISSQGPGLSPSHNAPPPPRHSAYLNLTTPSNASSPCLLPRLSRGPAMPARTGPGLRRGCRVPPPHPHCQCRRRQEHFDGGHS